jgi:hypothetical protein
MNKASLLYLKIILGFVFITSNSFAASDSSMTSVQAFVENSIENAVDVSNALLKKDRSNLICLKIGKLDHSVDFLAKLIGKTNETFDDQRKDKSRDAVWRAYEKTTALTGYCGELSGDTVAGFRYMPRLKPTETKRAIQYIKEIRNDLLDYSKATSKP